MTNLIFLFNFNNYFNRKLKRFDTLQQYLTEVENDYLEIPNCVNFTPGDGVSTQQLLPLGTYLLDTRCPDYMLVTDERGDVKQRWYVIDSPRVRGGQLNLQLQRDLIAETWDILKTAPIFVEKAIVAESDPAIWNRENITVNQIKKYEKLLKDSSGTAWIVGYITSGNLQRQIYLVDNDFTGVESVDSIEDWPYYKYSSGTKMVTGYSNVKLCVDGYDNNSTAHRILYSNILADEQTIAGGTSSSLHIKNPALGDSFAGVMMRNSAMSMRKFEEKIGYTNANEVSEFNALDNQILYDKKTEKFYKVTTNVDLSGVGLTSLDITRGDELALEMANNVAVSNGEVEYVYNPYAGDINTYKYACTIQYGTLSITELGKEGINFRLSNSRRRLNDQPYSMFAMEYNDTNMQVARQISSDLKGANELYDLQLLPYKPPVFNDTSTVDFDRIYRNNTEVGKIYWCPTSTFSFKIAHTEGYGNLKLENETDFWRLCSPNWNGVFEFSAAKNRGINGFNVDCTYKPYQPYIHVNPVFNNNGLYGKNYDDARGLICGGKFDLPQTSDAWATYERQNTNYNAIFNRQIENLEVQNTIARQNDIASMVAGTVAGAGSGAAIGSMAGGPIGAVIGAAGGAVASGLTGSLDLKNSRLLREEQMDYTRDMYNFNIQNIKAQPNSLVGIGALTANNKIWPVLELYSCTDTEKQAVKDKITYNGMTVERIGTINEFKNNSWLDNTWNYFKGRLIRIDVPDEDWHFVNELKNELDRGIFIKRGEQ